MLLSTSHVFLMTSFLLSCLSITPLLHHTLYSTQLISDYAGYEIISHISLMTIAITLPLAIEAWLDRDLHTTLTASRWVHIVSLLVPHIMMMYTTSIPVILCITALRDVWIRGALMSFMFVDKRFTYMRQMIYFGIIFIFGLHATVMLWSTLCTYCLPYSLVLCVRILFMLSIAVLLAVVLDILREPVDIGNNNRCSCEKFYPYYSLMIASGLLVKSSIKLYVGGWAHEVYSNIGLAGYMVVDSIISASAVAFSSHAARKDREMSQWMVAAKAGLIQNLSREYRSSIDGIIVALDRALDRPEGTYMSLRAVRTSCDAALLVLESALLANDIEDCALTLSRAPLPCIGILRSALLPLVRAGRQRGVRLAVNTMGTTPFHGFLVSMDEKLVRHAFQSLVMQAVFISMCNDEVQVNCSMVRRQPPSVLEKGVLLGKDNRVHVADIKPTNQTGAVLRVEVSSSQLEWSKQQEIFQAAMECSRVTAMDAHPPNLPLWVCKCIMEMHGGCMGALKREDTRWVLYIELPIVRAEPTLPTERINIPADDEYLYSGTDNIGQSDGSVSFRVLIGSSSREECRHTIDMLRGSVSGIACAFTVSDLIEQVRTSLYTGRTLDLVLVHTSLSGMGACSLVSRMRAMGYVGTAVLISNVKFKLTNDDFVQCGGQMVLIRPVKECDMNKCLFDARRLKECQLKYISNKPL